MIARIYVAASRLDARLARICIASLRYFHPVADIQLLIGGRLQWGLERELARHWDVRVADIPRGDYGWGFVKLEPLFSPRSERFLVLDADTAVTGPVLDDLSCTTAPFVVDNEHYEDAAIPARYFDWRKVGTVDPTAQAPSFVFNSGQWVGTSGVITRGDFDPWLQWDFPRRLRHPKLFFPGEQGVLNYVLAQKATREGLSVERRPLMRWPGRGMDGLDAGSVAAREAPSTIVHWAGMKKLRLGEMVGADLLALFEDFYYAHMPSARLARRLAVVQNHATHRWNDVAVRARLTWRKLKRRQGDVTA